MAQFQTHGIAQMNLKEQNQDLFLYEISFRQLKLLEFSLKLIQWYYFRCKNHCSQNL